MFTDVTFTSFCDFLVQILFPLLLTCLFASIAKWASADQPNASCTSSRLFFPLCLEPLLRMLLHCLDMEQLLPHELFLMAITSICITFFIIPCASLCLNNKAHHRYSFIHLKCISYLQYVWLSMNCLD